MIRVTLGKPRVIYNPPHNDMGHFFPGEYEIEEWFYMSIDQYMEKRQFDQFPMEPIGITKGEISTITDKVTTGQEIEYWDSPWGWELQRLIKRSRGLLWEFDAVSQDLGNYERRVILIGKKQMRRVNWFEAAVVYPVLRLICRVKNKLYEPKARREQAEWDGWYDKNIRKNG